MDFEEVDDLERLVMEGSDFLKQAAKDATDLKEAREAEYAEALAEYEKIIAKGKH